jgi:MFS family permease
MRVGMRFALILGFVGFVTSFGAHIVAVNLPVYAEQVGIGVALIGLLIAAYDFAEIVAKPIFGMLADRRGMKQTMLAGIALFIGASMLYLVLDPRFLIAVRFLQGIGAAALSAVSLALVGSYYTERRGQAFGLYNAVKGAGYVLSPLVGSVIVWKSHFSVIFLATAAIGVLAFLLCLPLPEPKTGAAEIFDDDDAFSLSGLRAVFRQADLWPWYVVIVVNMFFVGILFGFLPVRIHALHYQPLASGIFLAIAALSYLMVQPPAGILADKIGVGRTVQVGLAVSGIGIVLIPFVSGVLLVVISVLAGIGIGTVWTNTDTIMSQLAASGRLATTMGVAGSFKEFGDMLGPLLIGLLSQALGLTAGFVICGVMGLLSLVLIVRRPVVRIIDQKPVR